jgi:hypothetical protein
MPTCLPMPHSVLRTRHGVLPPTLPHLSGLVYYFYVRCLIHQALQAPQATRTEDSLLDCHPVCTTNANAVTTVTDLHVPLVGCLGERMAGSYWILHHTSSGAELLD